MKFIMNPTNICHNSKWAELALGIRAGLRKISQLILVSIRVKHSRI